MSYITPDIVEVKPLEEYKLYLKFKDGKEKIYDAKEIIKLPFYKRLQDKTYFNNVKPFGITVQWENGEDISPENLYFESTDI